MANRSRIPQIIAEFNNYINNTDTYQLAGTPQNAIRLGWTAADSTDWKARRTAWLPLYSKYIDPAQSTSVVKEDVKAAMKSFTVFAQPLLDIAAASAAATNADALVFNFVLERKKPSKLTVPLTNTMALDVKSLGSGEYSFKCRSSADSSRASKPKGADSVQLAISYGDAAPANPNDGTTKSLYTKASFNVQAEDEDSGKTMYVFGRWYNTKYPDLAAPWSTMVTV